MRIAFLLLTSYFFLLTYPYSSKSAGDIEYFAGDPVGVVGGEERDHRRYVVRLADAAQRGLRFDLLAEVAF